MNKLIKTLLISLIIITLVFIPLLFLLKYNVLSNALLINSNEKYIIISNNDYNKLKNKRYIQIIKDKNFYSFNFSTDWEYNQNSNTWSHWINLNTKEIEIVKIILDKNNIFGF